MKNVLRAASGLFGLLFLMSALQWIVDPASAAGGLGMPLLEGVGRSTQIGDIGALFVTAAVLILAGAWRENATLLRAAALLLGSAAVLRTVAWLAHGAAFVPVAVGAEVSATAVLLGTAWQFSSSSSSG
jgi:hypothetical protein